MSTITFNRLGEFVSESDLHIPDDVLKEATNTIELSAPEGALTGTIREPVSLLGSSVKRNVTPGKTVVECQFKVAENGTQGPHGNANRQFRASFFIKDESLSNASSLRSDFGTKSSIRCLKELAKCLGVAADGGLIATFAGMNTAMLNGKVFMAKAVIKEDKVDPDVLRFNVNGFAPIK